MQYYTARTLTMMDKISCCLHTLLLWLNVYLVSYLLGRGGCFPYLLISVFSSGVATPETLWIMVEVLL